MTRDLSPRLLYGLAAILLVLLGAVGYALWRDSQTSSIEFSLDDNGLSISEN